MPTNTNSATRCPQTRYIAPGRNRNVAIDFNPQLRSGEVLSGTPTVTVSPSGPTIANAQKNSASIVIDGRTCAANTAVLFTIDDCTVDTDYTVTANCSNNASVADELQATCDLRCRA